MAAVKQTVEQVGALESYKHGFVTDIDQEFAPKGLSEDTIRFISAKKGEPDWMLQWRLEAYERWLALEQPDWAKVSFPPIDYQDAYYYAAPTKKEGPKSLDEVDPELLEVYAKLGIPLKEQAVLAGEMSGHLFFADRYYGYDDAVYSGARLLEILSHSTKSLVEMVDALPKTYATPEIRFECPDDRKFQVVRDLTEHFRKEYQVIDIDGARIIFPDGWGLVRASNTQPVLVLRFEADSQTALTRIEAEVRAELDVLVK